MAIGAENITLSGSTAAISSASGGNSSLAGDINMGTSNLGLGGPTELILSGAISGSGMLSTTGSLMLSGNNSYTGLTWIYSNGTLKAQSANALGSTANGTVVMSGGTLDLQNVAIGAEALSIAGTLAASTGSSSLAGNVALGANTPVSVAGTALSLSGVVSGSYGITKSGSGTLTLAGANSYTGTTTINGGTLAVAADSGLGTAPGTATAGHLTLNGGTLASTASFSLDSNRGIALGTNNGTMDTASSTTLTYDGVIAGSGALTKIGAGTLALNGTDYSGVTTVIASASASVPIAPQIPSVAPAVVSGGGGRRRWHGHVRQHPLQSAPADGLWQCHSTQHRHGTQFGRRA